MVLVNTALCRGGGGGGGDIRKPWTSVVAARIKRTETAVVPNIPYFAVVVVIVIIFLCVLGNLSCVDEHGRDVG